MTATAAPTRRVDPVNELGWEASEMTQREAMVEVAIARAAQEVQAAMVVAKKFPRDETRSYQRIMQACRRRVLAEQSQYAYPRGGETVEGPSIRLAEVLAQSWGNIDFGIIELEQRNGESSVLAYAWDLETNTKSSKVFQVKHLRHTRMGTKNLNDPRDIYEMTANQGARRLRACILAIIPGDIVDAALVECDKTMAGENGEPLADRIRKMLGAFEELGVNQTMIETRLGHRLDASTETELARLRKIYRSLKDNMASIEDFFPSGNKPAPAQSSTLGEKLAAADGPKPAQQSPEPPAPAKSEEKEAPAPDVSSVVDAESPSDGGDFKDYEGFRAEMEDLAITKGISEADMGKMISAAVLGKGMKGKEQQIGVEVLRRWYQDFADGKGFFAKKD